jgi:hypothetical protein
MSDRSIQTAISRLAGTHKGDPMCYVNAIVDSVNIDTRTCSCTVTEGQTEYELLNVKLMSVIDDGLLIIPSINSQVKVIYSRDKESFVVQYSNIDKFYIDANDKIVFNHGENTTAKADVLKEQLNKTNELLNAILNIINGPPISELGNGSPSALQVSLQGAISDKQLGDYSEIENNNILHG